MGIDEWSSTEAQNTALGKYDVSRGEAPNASTSEHARVLMASIKALSDSVDERFENFVGENIEVDGITIENNSGTLTVKDVAIDGDTTDLLTAKIEEIEAAATQAGEDATAAQTAATQAAASAASAAAAITSASTAANLAAEQADIAAKAAARAQSGAAMAESAAQAVLAHSNLNWQRSEKAGAVVVYPVSGTSVELTASFVFTETDPEEGDKSPENPSTINGVASVSVYHANSNMLSYPYHDGNKAYKGVDAQMKEDGSVVFNGLDTIGNFYYNMDMAFPVKTGTVFYNTSKYKNRSNTSGILRIFNDAAGIGPTGSGGVMDAGQQWTADGTGTARATVRVNHNQQVTNLTVFPSLSVFAYSGEYEFPETKKYSVVFEDTYYGGEVDFTKGTITITHVMVEPDSLSVDISNAPADTASFEYTDTFGRTITTTGDTLEILGDVSGGTVVYKLKNPIVKTIEKIELQALPVLDKYSPRANTFFTDADSLVVGFAKHPARTEYELEQAIIASEGGE